MDRRGRRVVMGGGAAGSTQKYRAEKILFIFINTTCIVAKGIKSV
jgi:hypothetical protein